MHMFNIFRTEDKALASKSSPSLYKPTENPFMFVVDCYYVSKLIQTTVDMLGSRVTGML